jgi:2-dehydropantoate 2-reductase
MRIDIIGAGSMGMLFAKKIAQLESVFPILVTHSIKQATAINQNGIIYYDTRSGQQQQIKIFAQSWSEYSIMKKAVNEQPAYVLLTVKQHHLNEPLIAFLRQYAAVSVPIICLQNGIGHIEKLQQGHDTSSIWAAITTEAAKKTSENRVEHTGSGCTLIAHHNDVLPFREILQTVDLQCNTVTNLDWHIWRKCFINAVINPLTALLQLKNGQLLEVPHARQLISQLVIEILDFCNAKGIEDMASLEKIIEEVCVSTADNDSSMLQDVRHQRPTEIDAIVGTLIQEAEQLGLVMPVHRKLYRMIKELEKQFVQLSDEGESHAN